MTEAQVSPAKKHGKVGGGRYAFLPYLASTRLVLGTTRSMAFGTALRDGKYCGLPTFTRLSAFVHFHIWAAPPMEPLLCVLNYQKCVVHSSIPRFRDCVACVAVLLLGSVSVWSYFYRLSI
jgi:hypothetical protein